MRDTVRFHRATPRLVTVAAVVALALCLPTTPSLDAQQPRAPHGTLDTLSVRSARFPWNRRVWVYTPAGYVTRGATEYPLLLAFDGGDYVDSTTMRLPRILDSLIAAKRIPPLVAVMVDDSTSGVRTGELGSNAAFADFVADEILPRVYARWTVTRDPHRTVVTGTSAGGLAAAFVALRRPERFGKVISQSGAFWRGPEGQSEPYEWLATRVAAWPRRDVRFLLDVGALETIHVLGGTGPSFIDATRRFRDALTARGYPVRYTEVPGGRHTPETWRVRLPEDLVEVLGARDAP